MDTLSMFWCIICYRFFSNGWGVTMDTTNIDHKIKSQLTIEYMNAVYKTSSANHPNEYLYKIKQYKKAKYLKQLLAGVSQPSEWMFMF